MNTHLNLFACLVVACGSSAVSAQPAAESSTRPNVLFIAVDDLNHWVRHLGRNLQAITPEIDRLASRGVSFSRAYCASPVCNPSRAALMSGMRSSTTGVYNNRIDWRERVPVEKTLLTHFRRNGYWVGGSGKIYHGGFGRLEEWDVYHRPRNEVKPAATKPNRAGGIKWAELDGDDDVMNDHHVVSWAIEQLGREHEKPFFLACGIYRPHMPWSVPKKYFDLYPIEQIQLPPTLEEDLADLPPAGLRMAGGKDHRDVTRAGLWKEAVRAYLASITFADAEVGRLIEALDASAHARNTIVVLWGDHGWHLGEKRHWRKFTLWEEATRAPLIWVVPGLTPKTTICGRTVDFMSIYPTLCELTGLPIPEHVEGVSIRPLLADPTAEWKTPALTTHGFQNHTVRTERWRYIRYADGGEELYDHRIDPYEWTNLADREDLAALKSSLAGWFPRTNVPTPKASRAKKGENSARIRRRQRAVIER